MADIFDALAARALGLAPSLHPVPVPRFDPGAPPPPVLQLDVETEPPAAAPRGAVDGSPRPRTRSGEVPASPAGDAGDASTPPSPAPEPATATPLPALDQGREPPAGDAVDPTREGMRRSPERLEVTSPPARPARGRATGPQPGAHPLRSAATPVDPPVSSQPAAGSRDTTGRGSRAAGSPADAQPVPAVAPGHQRPVAARRRGPGPDDPSERREIRSTDRRETSSPAPVRVTVTVGQVEVRVPRPAPPAAPPRAPRPRPEPRLSLQDYLRQGRQP